MNTLTLIRWLTENKDRLEVTDIFVPSFLNPSISIRLESNKWQEVTSNPDVAAALKSIKLKSPALLQEPKRKRGRPRKLFPDNEPSYET